MEPSPYAGRETGRVRASRSYVKDAEAVEIEVDGLTAFFGVEAHGDEVLPTMGDEVEFHPNVGDIFGVDFESPDGYDGDLRMEPVDPDRVPPCRRAVIDPGDTDWDRLRRHLRDTGYFLHLANRGREPMEEVTEIDGEQVRFLVVELDRGRVTTVQVTDQTVLDQAAPGRGRSAPAGRGPSGSGADEGQGGSGGGTDWEPYVPTEVEPRKSFQEDVAGLDEIEERVQTLLSLVEGETYDRVTSIYPEDLVPQGVSLLLYGPPGCGKTLVSEAIAYEAKYNTSLDEDRVHYLPVECGDLVDMYAGTSEKNVRSAFDEARKRAQKGFAVLFLDEIETLIPSRSQPNLKRHERSLTNAFLDQMNKIGDNLLVIGATNLPFHIDSAAVRRFRDQMFIPQPDAEVMADVWRKHLGDLEASARENGYDVSLDYEELGERSVGFTPAEIADKVVGAAMRDDILPRAIDDLEAGKRPPIPDTKYFLSRLDETQPETIKRYVSDVTQDVSAVRDMQAYGELQEYIEEQAEELGIHGPLS